MVPICLVTGFLGTGKTTLLKRIVATNQQRRLVYLVNEFSPLDIDGALVSEEHPEVVSIPGGSIFCRCLVTEFIGQMKDIRKNFGDVDGVVIEASGTADPAVIADMLEETGLAKEYTLARVVCIVEPRSFLRLIHTLPNIIRQTKAADVVLLNKCDLYDEATLAETETELRKINPTLHIERCVRCQTDLPIFPETAPESRDLHGDYAKCRDPHYATFAMAPNHPVNPETLHSFIKANEDTIFRVKGHLDTPQGPVYFDYSKSGIHTEPVPADSSPRGLAWICHGQENADRIQRELSDFLADSSNK